MTVALNLGNLAAIDDYPSLFAKIKLWLDRDDLDLYIPTFISLAEAYLNRTLRTPEMESAVPVTLANGAITLPTDCLQIRGLTANGQPLRNYSPAQLLDAYGYAQGCPLAYAVSGRAITIAPQPAIAPPMTLSYWQRIPGLTLNNPSNWLIVSNPDVYLFGALAHAGGYITDPDAIQQWTTLFEASVESVSVWANKLRYGGPIVARAAVQESVRRPCFTGSGPATPILVATPATVVAPAPAPTPTPTPVAAFTSQPAITGTPQVGSVAAFTPGTVANGTIGSVRLRKDGADFADASSLSYQWTAAGSYVLRVTIAGTAIYADSPAVTVTAASSNSNISAPTIYFDQARTAGTNPPVIYFDEPDNTVLATDILELEVTSGGSTATGSVQQSIAQITAQDFTFTGFDNLPAGAFSVAARIRREKDIDGNALNPFLYSPYSNTLTDTLAAKTLPPATTTFDQNNKSAPIVLTNNNLSEQISGDYNAQGYQLVGLTATRADARYFELTIQYKSPTPNEYYAVRIAAPGTAPASPVGDPGTAVGFPPIAQGSVYGVGIQPASKDGTNDGKLIIYNPDGSISGQTNHTFATYLPLVGGTSGYSVLALNCGQAPFTIFPNALPNGAKRYN